MEQKYIWEKGTPVLIIGFSKDYPDQHTIARQWSSISAGRLAETFSPGSSVVLEDTPMPGNIPARGWKTSTVYRVASRGWAEGMTDAQYVSAIHGAWKNFFMISAEEGTDSLRGSRSFFMFRDTEEVPKRIGEGSTSIITKLEASGERTWPELTGMIPQIVSGLEWMLGGYYGWHTSEIDAHGRMKRWCVDCRKDHVLNP